MNLLLFVTVDPLFWKPIWLGKLADKYQTHCVKNWLRCQLLTSCHLYIFLVLFLSDSNLHFFHASMHCLYATCNWSRTTKSQVGLEKCMEFGPKYQKHTLERGLKKRSSSNTHFGYIAKMADVPAEFLVFTDNFSLLFYPHTSALTLWITQQMNQPSACVIYSERLQDRAVTLQPPVTSMMQMLHGSLWFLVSAIMVC